MIEVKKDLLTTKYTKVYCEAQEEQKYNAPHHFVVKKANAQVHCGNPNCVFKYCQYEDRALCQDQWPVDENTDVVCRVDFQEGPVKECGINGAGNEDVIAMVIDRLEHFQNTEFKCRENALAITKLEEALLWLRKRTMGRENRWVEGTHTV